jgi:hypothetical protein
MVLSSQRSLNGRFSESIRRSQAVERRTLLKVRSQQALVVRAQPRKTLQCPRCGGPVVCNPVSRGLKHRRNGRQPQIEIAVERGSRKYGDGGGECEGVSIQLWHGAA